MESDLNQLDRWLRVIGGLIVAAIVATVIPWGIIVAFTAPQMAGVVLVGLIFTIPAAFVLGLPAHLIQVRTGYTRYSDYGLAGVIVGALAGLLIPGSAGLTALSGAVATLAFRAVVGALVPGPPFRPDKNSHIGRGIGSRGGGRHERAAE